MDFKFEHKDYKSKECQIEIYSNEDGIVAKFFNKKIEPKKDRIVDYVFVDAGYGYLSLKRKGEDAILSGLLKKEFFSNSAIIRQAIDLVSEILPNLEDAYIPYNIERVQVYDSDNWTGETFEEIKDNE